MEGRGKQKIQLVQEKNSLSCPKTLSVSWLAETGLKVSVLTISLKIKLCNQIQRLLILPRKASPG